MIATDLKVEYLSSPIGIDVLEPRFSWLCQGGKKQTAYHLVVKRGEESVFDSGIVNSNQSHLIIYEGQELHSCDLLSWEVSLFDENGLEGAKASSFFEMGLLSKKDWKAKWISGDYLPKRNHRYPVDCFKKDFSLTKDVLKARLYVSANGIYEAKLNGERVGTFIFAPGITDYKKRVQYQTYDVTALLQQNNQLEVMLADGWYRGSIGAYGLINFFGRVTSFVAQLEITFKDGSRQMICSDKSFNWSADGPLRFADLKDGEIVDPSMVPSYSGMARVVKNKIVPSASDNVMVEEHEIFCGKELQSVNGKRIFDFQQNLNGYVSFAIKGKKGQKVTFSFAEHLGTNGELDFAGIQCLKPEGDFGFFTTFKMMTLQYDKIKRKLVLSPRQQIEFICSGKKEIYKTKFASFGFRYAQVENAADVEIEDFKSIAVYSSLQQTGTFSCSNQKISRLFLNTLWSMKSNYLDIPTDCPTRERMGWTGDAQVFFNTGAYLMDVAPFFNKWLKDVDDEQLKSGKEPAVVPFMGVKMLYGTSGSSTGWNDAVILIPSRFYQRYCDKRILEDNYAMMRKYAMFMIRHTGFKKNSDKKAHKDLAPYVYEKGFHFGEWLEPEEYRDDPRKAFKQSKLEEATAYLSYSLGEIAKVAALLGKKEDYVYFQKYSQGAKHAYQGLILAHGAPDTDRQAKLVRPLALDLADCETKKALEDRLAQSVINKDATIQTGFLSTGFILPVLQKAGHLDLAYRMLENEKAPSWLYEVDQGATTIWENWMASPNNKSDGVGSRNHYSPGAVCSWMFEGILGIIPDEKNHFILAPAPGGSLTHAEGSYLSVYGSVSSSWEKKGNGFNYHFVIPSNTTADLYLPGKEKAILEPGEYNF